MTQTKIKNIEGVGVGAVIGGGLFYGLSKAFHASAGWTIVWSIVGIGIGGLGGKIAVN